MPADVTGQSLRRRLREQRERMLDFRAAQEQHEAECAVALANAQEAIAAAVSEATGYERPARQIH